MKDEWGQRRWSGRSEGRAGERSEPEMETVKVPSHHRKSRAGREGEESTAGSEALIGAGG